ncbi:hypothetical protein GCM10010452_23720 [Crossiella cryophila]
MPAWFEHDGVHGSEGLLPWHTDFLNPPTRDPGRRSGRPAAGRRPTRTPCASWPPPGRARAASSPTLTGTVVQAAAANESGLLLIEFDDAVLRVEPDENYEAWSFAGPDGDKVICLPGGELAVWAAQPGS